MQPDVGSGRSHQGHHRGNPRRGQGGLQALPLSASPLAATAPHPGTSTGEDETTSASSISMDVVSVFPSESYSSVSGSSRTYSSSMSSTISSMSANSSSDASVSTASSSHSYGAYDIQQARDGFIQQASLALFLTYNLPYELFLHMCSYLGEEEYRSLLEVNRAFHSAITAADSIVWRRLCLDTWERKQSFSKFTALWRRQERLAWVEDLEVASLQQRMLMRVYSHNNVSHVSATCDAATESARRRDCMPPLHHGRLRRRKRRLPTSSYSNEICSEDRHDCVDDRCSVHDTSVKCHCSHHMSYTRRQAATGVTPPLLTSESLSSSTLRVDDGGNNDRAKSSGMLPEMCKARSPVLPLNRGEEVIVADSVFNIPSASPHTPRAKRHGVYRRRGRRHRRRHHRRSSRHGNFTSRRKHYSRRRKGNDHHSHRTHRRKGKHCKRRKRHHRKKHRSAPARRGEKRGNIATTAGCRKASRVLFPTPTYEAIKSTKPVLNAQHLGPVPPSFRLHNKGSSTSGGVSFSARAPASPALPKLSLPPAAVAVGRQSEPSQPSTQPTGAPGIPAPQSIPMSIPVTVAPTTDAVRSVSEVPTLYWWQMAPEQRHHYLLRMQREEERVAQLQQRQRDGISEEWSADDIFTLGGRDVQESSISSSYGSGCNSSSESNSILCASSRTATLSGFLSAASENQREGWRCGVEPTAQRASSCAAGRVCRKYSEGPTGRSSDSAPSSPSYSSRMERFHKREGAPVVHGAAPLNPAMITRHVDALCSTECPLSGTEAACDSCPLACSSRHTSTVVLRDSPQRSLGQHDRSRGGLRLVNDKCNHTDSSHSRKASKSSPGVSGTRRHTRHSTEPTRSPNPYRELEEAMIITHSKSVLLHNLKRHSQLPRSLTCRNVHCLRRHVGSPLHPAMSTHSPHPSHMKRDMSASFSMRALSTPVALLSDFTVAASVIPTGPAGIATGSGLNGMVPLLPTAVAGCGTDVVNHLSTLEPSLDVEDDEEDIRIPVSWKFALYMSRREARRTAISVQDLLEGTWMVCFRATGQVHPAQFLANQTLLVQSRAVVASSSLVDEETSDSHPTTILESAPLGMNHRTAIPDASPSMMPPLSFHVLQGGTQLLVHNFPPMKVARRSLTCFTASEPSSSNPSCTTTRNDSSPSLNAQARPTAKEAFEAEPEKTLRRLYRQQRAQDPSGESCKTPSTRTPSALTGGFEDTGCEFDVRNDWGWTITNFNVKIFSVDVSLPLYVERLQCIDGVERVVDM